MNNYCSLAELKAQLGISASADDVAILKTIEAASREIDKYCGQRFYVETAIRYFTGANRIWFDDCLLTVSTVKVDEDANASYEVTMTTSDYILFPLNKPHKDYMDIADTSDYGTFAYGVKKGVEIVGEWGYGDGYSSTPYTEQSKTVSAITAATSVINVISSNLAAGQTWLVDSEKMYLQDLTTSIATVMRGINGTTATTHSASSSIYVYDYPADVKQACLDLAEAIWENRGRRGMQSERIGDYSYTIAGTSLGKGLTESILDDSIRRYKRVNV